MRLSKKKRELHKYLPIVSPYLSTRRQVRQRSLDRVLQVAQRQVSRQKKAALARVYGTQSTVMCLLWTACKNRHKKALPS